VAAAVRGPASTDGEGRAAGGTPVPGALVDGTTAVRGGGGATSGAETAERLAASAGKAAALSVSLGAAAGVDEAVAAGR